MPDALPIPSWEDDVPVTSLRSVVEAHGKLPDLSHHWQEIVKAVGGTHNFYNCLARDDSLEGKLFGNRADLKVLASEVAMHLSSEERRALFSAIDELLDHAEWEDDSSLIDENAYQSYLRFMIFARPHVFPNLGVGSTGSLLAGWHKEEKSIHAEFLPDDQCIVLIKISSARGPEKIAWRGHVARLRSVVENNGAVECLN